MYVRTADTFKYEKLHLSELKRKRKKIKYVDCVAAFDIETTNIDKYDQALMYIWQFQLGDKWTIYGRSWQEFKDFKQRLEAVLPEDCFLVVYVHNLSFEWQYIKSIIDIDDVFAMSDRKILRVRSGRFEFRCSYIHSNMSLDKYLQTMNVKNKKVKGFDYKKKRYPWTRLTKEELRYCFNDVRGLVQAVTYEMQKDGDDLYTIPLTATGYSRRLAKEAIGGYIRYIKPMLPDLECFQALRRAFRGGNTHANRWNANIVLDSIREMMPIMSYDISSSYPAVMLTERFPRKLERTDPALFDEMYMHGKACLIHIYMEDVRLKDERWGCPYIPTAKCEHLHGSEADNGRVLKADALDMFITEVDFRIIMQEYDFKYDILDLWTGTLSPLPDRFRELLFKTYQEKTALKGVDDYLYSKKKNLFNSYYGMTVQNPCKPNYHFNGTIMELNDETMEDLIEDYQRSGWLPYQWGVWVTAYAREKLEAGLRAIPMDSFIYADTDSIKCIGNYDREFEELNRRYIREDLSALDSKGNRHYIGIFEKDNEYLRFKTMGAKKYAYEDLNGDLHITISGVNKKLGAKELKKLENFKEGFTFREAGGLGAVYNDEPAVTRCRIQGHQVEITSNLMLKPSTYTLGLTVEYGRLLNFLMNSDIRSSLHYER